jgi:glutathione S-transferase
MNPIILYQFQISPFCEKIRKVLDYKGLPYVREEAPLIDRAHLKEKTGATKVPIIVVNGEWVWESTRICRWLDEKFPDKPVVPKKSRDLYLNALLEDWADEALTKSLQPVKWLAGDNAARIMAVSQARYPNTLVMKFVHKAATFTLRREFKKKTADTGMKRITELFHEHLDMLDGLLRDELFFLGDLPQSGDFAAYGVIKLFEGLAGFEPVLKRANLVRWLRAIDKIPSTAMN